MSWPGPEEGTAGFGPVRDPEDARREPITASRASERVEVLAANMLVRGSLALGAFTRVSDCLNLQHGLLVLQDVEVLSPRHRTLAGSVSELTILRERTVLVGQRQAAGPSAAHPAAVIPKRRRPVTFILPGTVAHGSVHLPVDGSLSAFLESRDPTFVPMSDVDVVASSGEPLARYAFALVNRGAVIAARATEGDPDSSLPPMD